MVPEFVDRMRGSRWGRALPGGFQESSDVPYRFVPFPNRAAFGELHFFLLSLIAWIKVLSGWGLGRRLSQKGGLPSRLSNVLPYARASASSRPLR